MGSACFWELPLPEYRQELHIGKPLCGQNVFRIVMWAASSRNWAPGGLPTESSRRAVSEVAFKASGVVFSDTSTMEAFRRPPKRASYRRPPVAGGFLKEASCRRPPARGLL